MTDLLKYNLSEARTALREKKFSARELTEAYIAQMAKTKHLNAYITETPELALKAAEESDKRLQRGEARLMEGLPIGMKDLFCTEGVLTTAGSKMLANFIPPYESTVSANLKNAGSISLGKTNIDEFAMGSSVLTSAFGPTVNPWQRTGEDTSLVPGGSSGGSSAAVAAYSALAATGTDTGGSIRQPAAFCGLVGLKPTYGRCSRYGTVAFASSLDQAGPMTRTVKDAAIMLEAMAGHDLKDSTSSPLPVPCYEQALGQSIKELKIGVPKEYRPEGISEEIVTLWEKGMDWLREAGAEIVEISLPHTSYALPTYYIIAPAEASSNLARYDGVRFGLRVPGSTLDELYENTRAEGFGREVQRRILIGTYVLSAGYYDAYYLKAQKVRRLILEDFLKSFNSGIDFILTPTTPTAAFGLTEVSSDPVEMYLNDVLTVPASLAGLPAISVPAGLSNKGLPLGLQLIGPAFEEGKLLNVAEVIEKAANFQGLAKI